MAWTTITNAAVAAGAALTTALMTALRDNITAVAQRESGAPKVLGANLDLIERVEISGSPSVIDFTFTPDDYDEIRFVMARIQPSANDTGLDMRVSSDGGSTFRTASYVPAGGVSTSAFRVASDCGAASDETLSGSVRIYAPNASGQGYPAFITDTVHENSSGAFVATGNAGVLASGSFTVNAVRFLWAGGSNFNNTGTITAYGVRNN